MSWLISCFYPPARTPIFCTCDVGIMITHMRETKLDCCTEVDYMVRVRDPYRGTQRPPTTGRSPIRDKRVITAEITCRPSHSAINFPLYFVAFC